MHEILMHGGNYRCAGQFAEPPNINDCLWALHAGVLQAMQAMRGMGIIPGGGLNSGEMLNINYNVPRRPPSFPALTDLPPAPQADACSVGYARAEALTSSVRTTSSYTDAVATTAAAAPKLPALERPAIEAPPWAGVACQPPEQSSTDAIKARIASARAGMIADRKQARVTKITLYDMR